MRTRQRSVWGALVGRTSRRWVWWVLVFVCIARAAVLGQVIETRSKWDAGILTVELRGIHISTNSLVGAWQAIQQKATIRVVLVVDEQHKEDAPFRFDAGKCTVRDVLDAFTSAYPAYTYTQDTATGIMWLHPKSMAYESIFAAKIKVAKDAIGVPMVSGVMVKLTKFGSLRVQWGSPLYFTPVGFAMLHAFDYPVDLPEGIWSVRDIVNFCCVASPTVSFFVSISGDGIGHVLPTSILESRSRDVPPSALYFWQSEIDNSEQGAPTESEIVNALASKDPKVRSAARKYFKLQGAAIFPESLVRDAPAGEKGLWAAISILDLFVLTPGGAHPPSVARIRQELDSESNSSVSPGLSELATMELVRVAGYSMAMFQRLKDPLPDRKALVVNDWNDALKRLERAAKIPLPDSSAANVKRDMIRVLRHSKPVRDKLLELKPQWDGFSTSDIAVLGKTDIFSLP